MTGFFQKIEFINDPIANIIEGETLFVTDEKEKLTALSDIISNPIAIYGLGECAHWFHEIGIKRLGIEPIVALDRDPQDAFWYGIQTSTAERYISQIKHKIDQIEIIVCVGSRYNYNLIKEFLKTLGCLRVHFLHDFYEFHSFFISEPVDVSRRIQNNKQKFKFAYSLISEELSKEIFCRLLHVHVKREPLDIPASSQAHQYFPADLPVSINYSTYVCCGAYDGENIRRLNESIGKSETILCFEPEPKIYSKLAMCARQHIGQAADNIICFHNAVSDQNGIQSFISGDGLGSRLDKKGEDFAQCVKLDDALSGFKPTFISMDIEGAEVAAIQGGRQIIIDNLPDLAICVYHYPEQVADVIETIHSIFDGYQFYIRNYTGYLTETVVYATTKTSKSALTIPTLDPSNLKK